jgi:hypothetical protein
MQLELYVVEIWRDVKTKVAVEETWKYGTGRTHRPRQDGPAFILRDAGTGAVREEVDVEDNQPLRARSFPSPGRALKASTPKPR